MRERRDGMTEAFCRRCDQKVELDGGTFDPTATCPRCGGRALQPMEIVLDANPAVYGITLSSPGSPVSDPLPSVTVSSV